MRFCVSACLLSIALLLTGCSIHPLPKDVTPYSTRDIAYRIRCEAKDALRLELADLFLRSKDNRTKQLGEMVSDPSFDIAVLQDEHVDRDTRATINKFRGSAITYSFRFTITENNKNNGGLTFKLPFTTPNFSLGVKAGKDKKRVALRAFKITDSFVETSKLTKCHKHELTDKNIVYPITGNIGLAESINTFFGIVADKNLMSSFQDKLTYTTTLSGSLKPSLSLSPFKGAFSLTAANIDLEADRADMHEVDITIAHKDYIPRRRKFVRRKRFKPGAPGRTSRPSKNILSIDKRLENDVKMRSLFDAERNESISIDREILRELGR